MQEHKPFRFRSKFPMMQLSGLHKEQCSGLNGIALKINFVKTASVYKVDRDIKIVTMWNQHMRMMPRNVVGKGIDVALVRYSLFIELMDAQCRKTVHYYLLMSEKYKFLS